MQARCFKTLHTKNLLDGLRADSAECVDVFVPDIANTIQVLNLFTLMAQFQHLVNPTVTGGNDTRPAVTAFKEVDHVRG